MRVHVVPVAMLVLSVVCSAFLMSGQAEAQNRFKALNVVSPAIDGATMQERIINLEATVKALQAQLTNDEKKLQPASGEMDGKDFQEFVAKRFSTDNDAFIKVHSDFSDLTLRVNKLEGK